MYTKAKIPKLTRTFAFLIDSSAVANIAIIVLAVAVPVGVELPAHLTPVGEFVTGDGVECDYMPGGQSGYDHFGA